MNWLTDRLQEPSTYSGLIKLATAIAVFFYPDRAVDIVAAGTALNGLFNVTSKES